MATTTYNLRSVMLKAWMTAKHRAKHFGGTARSWFSLALKQAWAQEKAAQAKRAESNASVQEAIEKIKASHTTEAVALRQAEMAGFAARCGMPEPRRSFSRRFYL
jgi:hypothetical protein